MLHPRTSPCLFVIAHLNTLFLWVIVGILLVSCGSTATDAIGELNLQEYWQRQGFEQTEVTVLKNDGKGLLIGTENGLFRLEEQSFFALGLNDYEIRGISRFDDNSLLAGVKASDFSSGDTTLFRSQNDGKSWQPFMNNFGGNEKFTWIDKGPSEIGFSSDTVFIRGNGSVVRSVNGGRHWEIVLGKWNNYGGLAALLYLDPYNRGKIWAGGVSALSQAYLYKSSNYGDGKWINVTDGLSENVEAIAYDAITYPEKSDFVLVGLGGATTLSNNVKKSTDGGTSWRVVLDSTGVHAFARSQRDPEVIYASGRDSSTNLFFVATRDFGETWEKTIFEEGPSVVTTNDLAVMEIDGKEVLFLGTDQGLFSYVFEE